MRATLPYAPGARVQSLSVIQSVKCKWFTLIGPSLPRGPSLSLHLPMHTGPYHFSSRLLVSSLLRDPDNHLVSSLSLFGPYHPLLPSASSFSLPAPCSPFLFYLVDRPPVSLSLTCPTVPRHASRSHLKPNVAGRAVRFLLVTRGHRGLARPFVAPMSATSRPRSDTRGACVGCCGYPGSVAPADRALGFFDCPALLSFARPFGYPRPYARIPTTRSPLTDRTSSCRNFHFSRFTLPDRGSNIVGIR